MGVILKSNANKARKETVPVSITEAIASFFWSQFFLVWIQKDDCILRLQLQDDQITELNIRPKFLTRSEAGVASFFAIRCVASLGFISWTRSRENQSDWTRECSQHGLRYQLANQERPQFQ
jgi:hypothetical protein